MKVVTPDFLHKIIVVICIIALGNTYSQIKNSTNKTLFGKTIAAKSKNPNNGIIRCATVEYEQYLQEKNPKRMTNAQFETWLAPLVKKQTAARTSSKTAASSVITIPVVVHVIHSGQAIGTAPNITDAQVQSQITVLNQDYRKMLGTPGYNTNPVGADVEIEFVLAKVDPNGNPTNGIDRVNMCQSSWYPEEIEATVKPSTIWDSTQYLNMWTVKFTPLDLLGYAQPPNASGLPGLSSNGGDANTDGVVSGYSYFGSIAFNDSTFLLDTTYNKGRTMTHEVGHWLGLRHIWGDTACGDDYCADTPVHHDLNYGCPTKPSCNSATINEMVENYMDYTDDACMNIFTQNQKDRISVIINNAARRSSLKTSIKGTAIPLFANDAEIKIEAKDCNTNYACSTPPPPSNKQINIYNRGTSTLTSVTVNYTINGGANQSQTWNGSLAQNQSATVTLLNTALYGILNVAVVSTNGVTDQRTSNNTSTATFTAPITPTNYNFNTFTFRLQQDFWGDETTWELKDGSGVVKYSGGPYSGNHSEILPLPAVITENWTLADNQCYTFTINDSQGDGICCDGGNGNYDIKSTNGLTTVLSGSNFGYRESKSFTINTLATKEFETSTDIYLYPNPTKGTLNIQVPTAFGLPNSYTIINALGQKIIQKQISKEADLTINTSALSNGIYFITLVKENQKRTLRFIKE